MTKISKIILSYCTAGGIGFFLMLCFFLPNLGAQESFIPLFIQGDSAIGGKANLDTSQILRTSHLVLSKTLKNKSSLPERIRLELFEDATVELALKKDEGTFYKGMEIYRGRSQDDRFDHLPHYKDAILVYNPITNNYIVQIKTSEGSFEIRPTIKANTYRVTEWNPRGFSCRSNNIVIKSEKIGLAAKSGCNEQDKDGIYIADLFVGYSYDAAYAVQDYDAHALSLVEEVNNGLANSLVDNIRIRLVGTGISQHNPGVVTSVLGDIYEWFEEEIDLTAADYVASVQVPTGAENEAGGWAGVGGYSSVNSVNNTAAVFRHELGHNIGSNHCTPGILPYASGYNNGNVRTHMCGNDINFYSTPLVNDAFGNPIGDAAVADNARVWNERAAQVSARRRHTISFDNEDLGCMIALNNGRYHIQNVDSDKYLATLNASTLNGTVLAMSDDADASNAWDLIGLGNNQFRIVHVSSGRYIDVPGSSGVAGTDLIIWNGHDGNNQRFTFNEVFSGEFSIQAFNGQCLQIENGSNTTSQPIEQNTCDESRNTRWRLIPVSGSPAALAVQIQKTDVKCFGQDDGAAEALPSGGTGSYTFTWSTGASTSSIDRLAPGNYTVTVSDGANQIPYDFTINQSAALITTIAVTGSNGTDGSISIEATGGASPYLYHWSNGDSGDNLQNLKDGLYTVNITDAIGCAQSKEIYVPCIDQLNNCINQTTSIDHSVFDIGSAVTPNPAHEIAFFQVGLKKGVKLSLDLLSMDGTIHRTYLDDQFYPEGRHQIPLNIEDLQSGIYILRIRNGTMAMSKKIIVL